MRALAFEELEIFAYGLADHELILRLDPTDQKVRVQEAQVLVHDYTQIWMATFGAVQICSIGYTVQHMTTWSVHAGSQASAERCLFPLLHLDHKLLSQVISVL